MKRHHSRGFGLLEIILVFAIVIGAGAVTFEVFKSASASAQAADESDRLNAIAASITGSALGIAHNYDPMGGASPGMNTTNSAIGGSFLQKYYTSTANGGSTNQWGGSVLIGSFPYAASLNQAAGSLFVIQTSNVPQDVCPKLLAALASNSQFFGVVMTSTGTSSFGWISLKNKQAALYSGYTTNMENPSFGDYANACDNMYAFAGNRMSIAIMGQ